MFGAGLFLLVQLPLPFLFGPLAACLVAALFGIRLRELPAVQNGARAILGVAIGAAVTPALIARLASISGSIALIPVFTFVAALAGVWYFPGSAGSTGQPPISRPCPVA